MSSIIPFRFGTVSERQESDLSTLLATGTESINTSVFAYEHVIPPVRDWTNQEMADLARVQYLLSRAGVPLETDRGLTDEGDPWFVFCDATGEVFVHICRMGMIYLLDSPSLETPLKGHSFDTLVKGFIDRATAKVAALNVVPLNKDNKVYLHPSVMLTALIWSLFLLNDQMTNAAYASAIEDTKDTVDQAHYDVETAFVLLADALQDNGHALDSVMGQKAFAKLDGSDRDALGADKVSVISQSLPSSTIITSLSAIALAFGLLQPAESIAASLPELTVVTAAAAASDLILLPVEADDRHVPEKAAESTHTLKDHQLTHEADAAWFHVAQNITLPDTIAELGVISLDLLGMFVHARDALMEGAAIVSSGPMRDISYQGTAVAGSATQARPHASAAKVSPENSGDVTNQEAAASTPQTLSLEASSYSIQTFAQLAEQIVKHAAGLIVVHSTEAHPVAIAKVAGHLHDLILTSYTGNTSEAVKALFKFEVADPSATAKDETAKFGEENGLLAGTIDVVAAITVPPIASTTTPVETPSTKPQFGTYNPAAKELVDYLLSKPKDIVVISLANEIIILDKSALDAATDVAFAKSWSVEGGGIVSTIGHFSDYKDFGLLG